MIGSIVPRSGGPIIGQMAGIGGLSNPRIGDRLYISRRTVPAHLAHAFAKLDIASRAQLAAQVTARRH